MSGFFKFVVNLISNFFNFLKTLYLLLKFYFYRLVDLFNRVDSDLDSSRKKELEKQALDHEYYLHQHDKKLIYDLLFKQEWFVFSDLVRLIKESVKYKKFQKNFNTFRSYFRFLNTKKGFYIFSDHDIKLLKSFGRLMFAYIRYFWFWIKIWIVPLSIGFIIMYYSMVLRCIPFNKTVFFWLSFGMIFYWIISGFVYFIKKYQFGKFTSAIQRFWKRSYILFWLIEFSLFLVYFYLTWNASQESFYMLDHAQNLKTHLFSWRLFFSKLMTLTILLILCYFLLLSLKWNILGKNVILVLLITITLVNTIWTEFYQFFHIVNHYGCFNWMFETEKRIFSLELEPRKTRTVNHYVMLLIMLKFWHVVFIVIFWFFFVLRALEIGRLRYPLLSANLQNFLILYLFAWVNMFPWFKFFFRKYLDNSYYWFYTNNRELGYRIFFNDIKLFYYGFLSFFEQLFYWNPYWKPLNYNFIYWSLDDENFLFSYRKACIKNIILSSLEHDFKKNQ